MVSYLYWHPLHYDPHGISYSYHYCGWRYRVSLPRMSRHWTGSPTVFPFLWYDSSTKLLVPSSSRQSSEPACLVVVIWLRAPQLQRSLAAREREKAWKVSFALFTASIRDLAIKTYFRLWNRTRMIVWHLFVWSHDEAVSITSELALSKHPITSSSDLSDYWRHLYFITIRIEFKGAFRHSKHGSVLIARKHAFKFLVRLINVTRKRLLRRLCSAKVI